MTRKIRKIRTVNTYPDAPVMSAATHLLWFLIGIIIVPLLSGILVWEFCNWLKGLGIGT